MCPPLLTVRQPTGMMAYTNYLLHFTGQLFQPGLMLQMYSISDGAAARVSAGQTTMLCCRKYKGNNGQYVPLIAADFCAVSLRPCVGTPSKTCSIGLCAKSARGYFLHRFTDLPPKMAERGHVDPCTCPRLALKA